MLEACCFLVLRSTHDFLAFAHNAPHVFNCIALKWACYFFFSAIFSFRFHLHSQSSRGHFFFSGSRGLPRFYFSSSLVWLFSRISPSPPYVAADEGAFFRLSYSRPEKRERLLFPPAMFLLLRTVTWKHVPTVWIRNYDWKQQHTYPHIHKYILPHNLLLPLTPIYRRGMGQKRKESSRSV